MDKDVAIDFETVRDASVAAGSEMKEEKNEAGFTVERSKTRRKKGRRRRKLRFDLSFDGSNYSGWQYHPNSEKPAVYTVVADAWSKATNEPNYGPVAAARLDAGVSARHQICSVRTQREWTKTELEILHQTMNNRLPPDIRCLCVMPCSVKFHAITSAKKKVYSYKVAILPSADDHDQSCTAKNAFVQCWSKKESSIDVAAVREACAQFVGTHDFRKFTARSGPWSEEQRSPIRTIYSCNTTFENNLLEIIYTGDGFLKHQIRRMVGCALAVGEGELQLHHITAALELDSDTAFPKPLRYFEAPAIGLTLKEVQLSENKSTNIDNFVN